MTGPEGAGRIRPEHESLSGYLSQVLTIEQLERPLLVTFSQWGYTVATVGEIAAELHAMGSRPLLALWANETPVRDVGWNASRRLARLAGSPMRDDLLRRGLESIGIPASAFVSPPIRRWRPPSDLPHVGRINRSAIRLLRYRGSNMGRPILQVPPDTETPLTDAFLWPQRWTNACIRSYAETFDQVASAISRYGATALIVFNGRFLHDSAAQGAAEAAGLPVLAYDFGGYDTDYDLTIDETHDWSALQQRMLALYERWPGEERDELGASWFEERRAHTDPRNQMFVDAQTPGQGVDRPTNRRLVVFFSSSGDEISELNLDWSEFFGSQAGALETLAEACRRRPDTMLLVRTHPHKRLKPRQDVADWHEAVRRAAPDAHLDEYSDIDSYTLMGQADVVVTYGSTTGVEAAYAKRPVIVMGPSAYDELGCATRVRRLDELEEAIDAAVPGWWPGAVAFGLMMRRRGMLSRHVVRDGDGSESIGGVVLRDAHPLVLKASDVMGRLQKWWLTRS